MLRNTRIKIRKSKEKYKRKMASRATALVSSTQLMTKKCKEKSAKKTKE